MLSLKSYGKSMVVAALALFVLPVPGPPATLTPNAEAQGAFRRVRPAPPENAPPPQAPANPASQTPSQAPAAAAPSNQQAANQQPAPAALPPSLLEQPAQPAQIQFAQDTLSIRADNSSLNEILRSFSTRSGMSIEGLRDDQRVFGSFGPGKPNEVLAKLLNGTPYDVLMVGDLSNGAPRRLVLSPASPAPPASAPQTPMNQATNQQDDGDAQAQPPSYPMPPNRSVKTPQELFRELQAIRQKQQGRQ